MGGGAHFPLKKLGVSQDAMLVCYLFCPNNTTTLDNWTESYMSVHPCTCFCLWNPVALHHSLGGRLLYYDVFHHDFPGHNWVRSGKLGCKSKHPSAMDEPQMPKKNGSSWIFNNVFKGSQLQKFFGEFLQLPSNKTNEASIGFNLTNSNHVRLQKRKLVISKSDSSWQDNMAIFT